MRAQIVSADPLAHPTPLLVLPLFKGEEGLIGIFSRVDEMVAGALGRAISAGDFRGKTEETLLLYPPSESPQERILVIGLGERDAFGAEILRRVSGRGVRVAQNAARSTIASRTWLVCGRMTSSSSGA